MKYNKICLTSNAYSYNNFDDEYPGVRVIIKTSNDKVP